MSLLSAMRAVIVCLANLLMLVDSDFMSIGKLSEGLAQTLMCCIILLRITKMFKTSKH